MNNDNPFISKPNQAEVNSHEGKINLQECLGALKNMKNFKSPDIDSFTIEFYKLFCNDIKFPLLNCLNESLERGNFSVSQHQGLITCLPKRRKRETFYEKLASNRTSLC